MAGDAVNLPWSTTYRRRHAPHWFVVDGRHPAGGWHVTDPFCALDEHGEQHPWSGVVPDAAFPAILRTAAPAPEQALREWYTFGDCGPEPPGLTYQYLMPGDRTDQTGPGLLPGPAAGRRLAGRPGCGAAAQQAFCRRRSPRLLPPSGRPVGRGPAPRATVSGSEESAGRAQPGCSGGGRGSLRALLAMLTEVERAESHAEAVTDQAPSASEDTSS